MNKPIVIFIITSFLLGCFSTSRFYNYKIDKIYKKQKEEQIALLIDANKKNEETNKIKEMLKLKEKESYEKIKEIEDINDQYLRDIDDLNIRLFVKTKSDSCIQTGKNNTTSTPNGKTTKSELDARTSREIIEITKKADKYKTQLEELQNYILEYNKNIKD